jgi:hypothetical protein
MIDAGPSSRAFLSCNLATFSKPRGCTFINLFLIGAGAGGKGGRSNTSNNPYGGNGGGGGGYTTATYLAFMLPQTLYVTVPMGGAGGVGSLVAGGSPAPTLVSADTRAVSQNYLAAAGGGVGTGVGGAVNGGLAIPFSNWAIEYSSIAGNAGAAGAGPGVAGSASLGTGIPILGGAGGGGSQAAGGISAVSSSPFVGFAGPAVKTTPTACNGFMWGNYPVVYGGVGGFDGVGTVALAGRCGGQAFGAGGGGGGAGTGVGAVGGNGGPGLVIISWW